MKKKTIFGYYLSMGVLCAGLFAACDNDPDIDSSEKDKTLSGIITQYVNKTVIPTYKNLADESLVLYKTVETFKNEKTDANLKKVADQWIKTRGYWELSEAFLFGAVKDFGIDPHIDTWPLDEKAFLNTLDDKKSIESMDSEDGDVWVDEVLGDRLLGFHGIEYIFYKEGKVKSANEIKDNELIYALAVTGDLRNQCIRLEAAWAGYDAVSKEKQTLIDDRELVITPSTSSFAYGENMIKAGQLGSGYPTVTAGANAILDGCTTISEEVGNLKIGNAYRGDDKNYLESPYSYNSLEDFEDNIVSIQNAYLGGADDKNRGASLSNYIKSVNPIVDAKVIAATENAIAKIRAIPFPFEKNFASTQAGEAIEACSELTAALNEAKQALLSGN
ncbi:MAG TPA: peptidase M75 [Porphyromonadaceae bacterium]|jgi:hypothetical protein|nr:peptidase M75 [Porphyromonadaceae bacterium]HBL33768.1 peptidase M75 [Porphyromonadaceae bacterium]HCM22269.1 peptidase M75 [Porphyromonadaceae bacterium]